MNESLFLVQILTIVSFTFLCAKWGKEALLANAAFQALFANLFLLKQIDLFGFEVTASDAFAVGSMLSINLLREKFGKEAGRLSIRMSFLFLFLFALLSQIHLFYTPSPSDNAHAAYDHLYSIAPRLFFSSIATFWLVQQFDLRFFGWLTHLLPQRSFAIRSTLSLTVSQALDTLIFTFLGLYGLVASIFDILFFSYFVKLAAIGALFPLSAYLWRNRVRNSA